MSDQYLQKHLRSPPSPQRPEKYMVQCIPCLQNSSNLTIAIYKFALDSQVHTVHVRHVAYTVYPQMVHNRFIYDPSGAPDNPGGPAPLKNGLRRTLR